MKETNEKQPERLVVALRIRPMKNEEKARGCRVVTEKVDNTSIVLYSRAQYTTTTSLYQEKKNDLYYAFDYAFGADSTQTEVYQATSKPLVDSVLNGYNATVFAYGATGSGKTYTMVGTPENPGCMVRAIDDIFKSLRGNVANNFKVTMSYLEIYNENIRDLLNPDKVNLEIREDVKGTHVFGLSEVSTQNTQEIMTLLSKGNSQRTEEKTAANTKSSRSHALLWVNVKQISKTAVISSERAKFGKLFMIDLAGSERAAHTKNVGKRLKEGAHINRSLLALGNCINALAENKTKFVNFRDSKLTRLLRESLSGNGYTVMIAHVSPSDRNRDEVRHTLVYADRAKNISNKVRRNVLDVSYHVSQYQGIISELRTEIGRLKEKIKHERESQPQSTDFNDAANKNELKNLRDEMVLNFKEQMKMRHGLMKIENHLLSLTMEFEKQNIIINEWETEKAKLISDKKMDRKVSSQMENIKKKIIRADDNESGIEDMDDATKEYEEDEKEESEKKTKEIEEIDDEEITVKEPESIQNAWSELVSIQREKYRFSRTKSDLEQDLEECKSRQIELENELPSRISTEEEREILSLLCRVHELEIEKMEIQREGYIKEHEVRKRDLLILKYNKQRNLCDEIIQRQKKLIEEMEIKKQLGEMSGPLGSPMPRELMELYELYQQELDTRLIDKKETKYLSEISIMFRTPSTLSLRGSEQSDLGHHPILPPIIQERQEEKLFLSRTDLRDKTLPGGEIGLSMDDCKLNSDSASGELESGIPSLPPILTMQRSNSEISCSRISRSSAAPILRKSRIPRRMSLIRKSDVSRASTASSSPQMEQPHKNSEVIQRKENKKKEVKRRRRKTRHSDPFENIGMPILRF